MKMKSSFGKESDLTNKPDEGTPRYTDFSSPAEPTAGETEQANPSSKGGKPASVPYHTRRHRS